MPEVAALTGLPAGQVRSRVREALFDVVPPPAGTSPPHIYWMRDEVERRAKEREEASS